MSNNGTATMEVFDLDALDAEGKPFPFKHNGKSYELPPDMDLVTLGAIDSGDFDRAMERMLGDDVWKGIRESGKPFGVKKFMALFEAYAKHLGVPSLGGSSASAVS